MKFLNKRPKLRDVEEEVNSLFEVMGSDVFMIIDILVYSFIFTLLLSSKLHSLFMSILFFIGCFSVFYCIYFFIFNRLFKKKAKFLT